MKLFICYNPCKQEDYESFIKTGVFDNYEIISLLQKMNEVMNASKEPDSNDEYIMSALINNNRSLLLTDNILNLVQYNYNQAYDLITSVKYFDVYYDLNPIHSNGSNWSDEEISVLKTLFPLYEGKIIKKILIDRTVESIKKKARSLNLLKDSSVDMSEVNKYIKPMFKEVSDPVSHLSVISMRSVSDLIAISDYDKDISCRVLRYVTKFLPVDDILTYGNHVCDKYDISRTHILKSSMSYNRQDVFEYFEKNDIGIVKDYYRSLLSCDYDSKLFHIYNDNSPIPEELVERKYKNANYTDYGLSADVFKYIIRRIYLVSFAEFIENAGNNDIAIDSINYLLNKVDTNLTDLLVARDFIMMDQFKSFFSFIGYLSDSEFKKYCKQLSKKYDSLSATNYDEVINELGKRYDYNAAKVCSKILSMRILAARSTDIDKILNICVANGKLVLTKKLIKSLSVSPYYSNLISRKTNKFQMTTVDDNVSDYDIMLAIMNAASTNNSSLAQVLIDELKRRSSDEVIDGLEPSVRRHFLNYGNSAIVDKLFKADK